MSIWPLEHCIYSSATSLNALLLTPAATGSLTLVFFDTPSGDQQAKGFVFDKLCVS